MPNASYGPSGPLAGAIGWINFPTTELVPNESISIVNTLRDGSTISFNLTNTGDLNWQSFVCVDALPWAPFGSSTGYPGITGPVTLLTTQNTAFINLLSFTDIVVKDPLGVTIPKYTIVLADAETTGLDESIVYETNGTPFNLLGVLGTGASPMYSSIDQTIVYSNGFLSSTYQSYLLSTDSPSNIGVKLSVVNRSGGQGIAMGVVLTKVSLAKEVYNRVDVNDQFDLSITYDSITATTITTGISNGIQPETTSIYMSSDSLNTVPVIINETMAPGSIGVLSNNYLSTVKNSNITPGGGTVPSISSLGETISITFGDYILSTIVNTAIISTLNTTKSVDKSLTFPGDTLTYNIELNNLGPSTILNSIFIDTIPNQGSFVENSLKVNGVTLPGEIVSSNGLSIGTIPIGTTTITFDILLQNSLPMGTLIENISTVYGYNIFVPDTITIVSNSNSTTSKVLGLADLANMKMLSSTSYSTCGDTITYTISLPNTGNSTAMNVILFDTIPNGTTLIENSVIVNGVVKIGYNPNLGITIPDIMPGDVSTISFKVKISC